MESERMQLATSAVVVVAAGDRASAGRMAAAIAGAGARVAVFEPSTSPAADARAVVELVAELAGPRPS